MEDGSGLARLLVLASLPSDAVPLLASKAERVLPSPFLPFVVASFVDFAVILFVSTSLLADSCLELCSAGMSLLLAVFLVSLSFSD